MNTIILAGNLLNKSVRTSRTTGNEYVVFSVVSEDKQFEFVGFKDVVVIIKNSNEGDFVCVQGMLESEVREGKNGSKFLSYKLIASRVTTTNNQENKNSSNVTPPTVSPSDIDLIPF